MGKSSLSKKDIVARLRVESHLDKAQIKISFHAAEDIDPSVKVLSAQEVRNMAFYLMLICKCP